MQIEHAMHNLHDFIKRRLESDVYKRLNFVPALLILGSRQCGKSTLVKMIARERANFLYLDLQNPADLNRPSEPQLFFEANKNRIICLDEIQQTSQLL